MKKTMCRWCGGEMTIEDDSECDLHYIWQCSQCKVISNYFITESEALAWASQPIPFIGKEKDTNSYSSPIMRGIQQELNLFIESITAALAVREEEQK